VADNRTFRHGDTIWHIRESWYDFDMFYIPNTLFDYLLAQATDLHPPCILNLVYCFGTLGGATLPHSNHYCLATKMKTVAKERIANASFDPPYAFGLIFT
jgi:hypothetical protein